MIEFLAPMIGFLGVVAGGLLTAWWQHQQRKIDAKRADDALMRDRAADVFAEISAIRSGVLPATVSIMSRLAETSDVSAGPGIAVPSIDRLRALLLVYFPDAMPILIDYETSMKSAATSFDEKLGPDFAADVAKMKGRLLSSAIKTMFALPKAMDDIERHLGNAIARFRVGNRHR